MANTMDRLRELGERMVARSQHCENTKDAIAMQEHAAELDAILRESEAQGDAGAVEALITDLVDEAYQEGKQGRPAWGQRLTDIKHDLICRLAARATPRTEPAEGRPPKPAECANGCPPQQVCDHCQWPPGPDVEPAEGRESECPWGGCGDCVGHEVTQPAGDGARVTEADRELRERAGQMILRLGQFALIQRRRRYPKNAELAAECAELLAALAAREGGA